MERILMRFETLKVETLRKLDELFRKKVQLEEQWKENESQIQYQRGVMEALAEAQKVVTEVHKRQVLDEHIAKRQGDHKEKVEEIIKQ